ncbi:MAG: ribosome maturation factor RimM [Sphingomonadales bacterium]
MAPAGRVLVGAIVGVHGVKGAVKIKSFTAAPMTLATLTPLYAGEDGPALPLYAVRATKTGLLAMVRGVDDREAALRLRGTGLYTERAALPARLQADEYFAADLMGLRVQDLSGVDIGTVQAVENYGAGDILVIALAGDSAARRQAMAPFTRQAVPDVDLERGVITLDRAFLA